MYANTHFGLGMPGQTLVAFHDEEWNSPYLPWSKVFRSDLSCEEKLAHAQWKHELPAPGMPLQLSGVIRQNIRDRMWFRKRASAC